MSVPKTKPHRSQRRESYRCHCERGATERRPDSGCSDAKSYQARTKDVGPSIVGFGSYHYKYASGHEGDSALAAFAVRGSELVVYMAPGFESRDVLLAKLGKHKTGKVCVYIRRLAARGKTSG